MSPPLEPLTAEELQALDAQYMRVPPFEQWIAGAADRRLWTDASRDLQAVRSTIDAPGVYDRALDVTLRAAAFDSGAIEGLYPTDRGLTRTVAVQGALWEELVVERSPSALSHFEAQLSAYEMVLDVATGHRPITEALIRQLHEELTGGQATYVVHTSQGPQEQALPRGEYKHHPNHVLTAAGDPHAYAPVALTADEMHRLVGELSSHAFADADAAQQAAYAHYALVAIHPFADGNGRVARALASIYTYRSASVPLLVLADQRDRYFDALASADRGRVGTFVAFVDDCLRLALRMVADNLKAAMEPRAEDALSRFQLMTTAHGGLTHTQLDEVADLVLSELADALRAELDGLTLPAGVSADVLEGVGGRNDVPDGYRSVMVNGGRSVRLHVQSAPPADANLVFLIRPYIAVDRSNSEPIRIDVMESPLNLGLSLDETHPIISSAGHHRIRTFAGRVTGAAFADLQAAAEQSLRGHGYEP